MTFWPHTGAIITSTERKLRAYSLQTGDFSVQKEVFLRRLKNQALDAGLPLSVAHLNILTMYGYWSW